MQDKYKIGWLRGKLTLVYYDAAGKRHRHALGTDDPRAAERLAPALYAELTRPRGTSTKELWSAYMLDMEGRAVVGTMKHTWKALEARFASMPLDAITVADCRAHTDERRKAGIQDGTIHTELGHLRMVALWAERHKHVTKAPSIERPAKPRPLDHHLTKEQCGALIAAARHPHIRTYIIMALATGARNRAILDLTWDRVNFDTGLIDLRNPDMTAPHKGRAIVPMNKTLRRALEEALARSSGGHVVEWGGSRVSKVRRALTLAGNRAGIGKVWPHLLRHSAAVHMAEASIDMEEISQFLGHGDIETTRRIYARYSPTYLRKAASALEYDMGEDVG